MNQPISIFWFRRDLRLDDNAGLHHALRAGRQVLPIFIFDTDILDGLAAKKDRRVQFIHDTLQHMHQTLAKAGSTLYALYSTPIEAFKKLITEYAIAAVYTNHDYEPYARQRDEAIAAFLQENGIAFHSFKDHVIFEKNEILKDNNEPYTVYTPYSRKWKEKLNAFYLKSYPTDKYKGNFILCSPLPIPAITDIGFEETEPVRISPVLDESIARNYDKTRDFPAINGTTHLSIHLRFGTVSIRHLATQAHELNATLLNELIWRDFYHMILWHFPHVVSHSFKKEYDKIEWRRNEQEFQRWCDGNTGYPIVDAGMRQLNATGYMHNRVRMITASFLTKHLFLEWRMGEAYFAEKLLDYDLAANNGGWQWAAGCGCDAAPYFRIFNPSLQTEKFDPKHEYIKRWVPEFTNSATYAPMVDHKYARERCLKLYKQYLNK